jgi:hypothetical protein
MSTNFFKTKPYDHQIEALNRGMSPAVLWLSHGDGHRQVQGFD